MICPEVADDPVKASDLLQYEESQLVQFLVQRYEPAVGFEITDAERFFDLSLEQKHELGNKLKSAIPLAKNAFATKHLSDSLTARLTSVALGREPVERPMPLYEPFDQSTAPFEQNNGHRRSTSIASLPTTQSEGDDLPEEIAAYYSLIESGGRPIYSPPDQPTLWMDRPNATDVMRPWLDNPEAEDQNDDIENVLKKQYSRWWDFRRWQWDNRRGLRVHDDGLSAFLASKRSFLLHMNMDLDGTDPFWNDIWEREWRHKRTELQLAKGSTFAAYKNAVNRSLAPYNFKRRLELKKDPLRQSKWTEWLEYLNYERFWSEQLFKGAEFEEQQYQQAWTMFEALCPESRPFEEETYVHGDQKSAYVRTRKLHTELETKKQVVKQFLDGTRAYREAETKSYSQRNRLKWVLKEAHALDQELTKQARESKKQRQKRPRNEGLGSIEENVSKRPRGGLKASEIIPDRPQGQLQ